MPQWKYTALFELTTNPASPNQPDRRGGWSESVYSSRGPTEVTGALTELQYFQRLCLKRAALVSGACKIMGQRYQQVDPPGSSGSSSRTYPGTAALATDVPQMALLFRVPSVGSTNKRQLILRALPDARVVGGEYTPSSAYTAAINAYLAELQGWKFRARQMDAAQQTAISISSGGVVTFSGANPFSVGQIVRVLRTVNAAGRKIGGLFLVDSIVPTGTATLAGWNLGATVGGRVRLEVIIYPVMDAINAELLRVVVKKVGRPFVQYVGKASTRR